MPSQFKTTKHIIFVDCDYMTSLGVSQVPKSPKPSIFGETMTTTDKSAQTNYLTLAHARWVNIAIG